MRAESLKSDPGGDSAVVMCYHSEKRHTLTRVLCTHSRVHVLHSTQQLHEVRMSFSSGSALNKLKQLPPAYKPHKTSGLLSLWCWLSQ